MRNALDGVVIGLALVGSVAYALNALGPRTLRRRLLGLLAAGLRRLPLRGLQAVAGRIEGAAAGGAGACGGCGSCGGAESAVREVRVSPSSIERRRS